MPLAHRQFLRADTFRYSRIGKNRRKLMKWRRPRGKHNKLRLKRFSHPEQPGIGFGTPRTIEYRIKGLLPVVVHNMKELLTLNPKENIMILARIGAKKKLDLMKYAEEHNIKISNVAKERKEVKGAKA